MRIIDGRNERQLAGLFRRDVRSDRAFERRVHGIVDRVRKGGDHALAGFARRFDGTRGALEVSSDEIRAGAASVAPDVRRAIRQAARHIARVAFRQIPKHWDLAVAPGVSIEQRIEPIARVGCYVPWAKTGPSCRNDKVTMLVIDCTEDGIFNFRFFIWNRFTGVQNTFFISKKLRQEIARKVWCEALGNTVTHGNNGNSLSC